jgi:hypothetical protein
MDVVHAAPSCALHPQQPAHAACERCGNYVCHLCSGSGQHRMCATCRARLGLMDFPFSRQQWSLEGIVGYSWHVFKREWRVFVLAGLILLGVTYGLAFAFQLLLMLTMMPFADDPAMAGGLTVGFAVISNVVQMAVQGWLILGIFDLCFSALGGQPVELKQLFGQYAKVGKLLLQYLVLSLAFGVPVALIGGAIFALGLWESAEAVMLGFAIAVAVLAIPLMYVGLGLVFMQAELAYDDQVGALEAIRRSWIMARGHRLWTLAVFILFSVVAMAGVVACCVGVVATLGIAQLILAAWYLTLRHGADVPAATRQPRNP